MKNDLGFKYNEYEIVSKEELAPSTFLFRFRGRLNFSPGQFVQAAFDRFGEATFAPCSDIENKEFFELCIRGCGATTNQIIKLLPGDKLKIRGPYGNGWPLAKLLGKEIVLIAGGLGLVPLRPLINELIRNKSEFKKISLIVGAKTDHHLLFENDLIAWKKKINQVEAYVEHRDRDFWGEKGMITEPLKKLRLDKKAVALICGPEIMVPYCNDILLSKDVLEKNIFISFERRMECGIGICQHCNIGKYLVCQDGPVFSLDKIKGELNK